MARRTGFTTMALMAGLAMTTPGAMARQMAGAGIPGNKDVAQAGTSGIRIDRLSPEQRRIWASLSRIVFAADIFGHPLHPKLQTLWRSVDESAATTYIEIPKAAAKNKAGEFFIEKFDTQGGKHVLSIHLYVKVIDKAVASNYARRADGFIPFDGLNRVERYAEVLGHELAHALCVLKDPDHLNLVNEQKSLNGALRSFLHKGTGGFSFDAKTWSLMGRLETLEMQIEAVPNKTEIEVWQELVSHGRPQKDVPPQIAREANEDEQ